MGRTPLNEGSARRKDLSDNIQHSKETDINAPGGIRTSNPSKQAALDCAATGIGNKFKTGIKTVKSSLVHAMTAQREERYSSTHV
jgi:hypothetical protein